MSSPQRSGPGIPPGEGADCAAPVFTASHPLAERIKELNSLCGISEILRALREAGGNRTKAAGLLGISRRALFRKIAAP
jgi:transcriptional regulator with PAS, ATPase and Fis domain